MTDLLVVWQKPTQQCKGFLNMHSLIPSPPSFLLMHRAWGCWVWTFCPAPTLLSIPEVALPFSFLQSHPFPPHLEWDPFAVPSLSRIFYLFPLPGSYVTSKHCGPPDPCSPLPSQHRLSLPFHSFSFPLRLCLFILAPSIFLEHLLYMSSILLSEMQWMSVLLELPIQRWRQNLNPAS